MVIVIESTANGQKTQPSQSPTIIFVQRLLVGCKLVGNELVKPQVLIERSYYVITVGVSKGEFCLTTVNVSTRVGIASDVQPMSPPSLAVSRVG